MRVLLWGLRKATLGGRKHFLGGKTVIKNIFDKKEKG